MECRRWKMKVLLWSKAWCMLDSNKESESCSSEPGSRWKCCGDGLSVMEALVWMFLWLSQVLPAMSELPHPFNLNLSSIHFIHHLAWQSGPGTPIGVNYNVSVHSEKGTSWEPVAGCEHVQYPLVCNLTQAFSDPRLAYYTRVTALLGGQTSYEVTQKPFLPIRDTQLDLPLLSVTSCGRNLCVDLQPPMEHLRDVYDSFQYKLQITSNSTDGALFFEDTKTLKRVILSNLAQSRQYCVSVKFSDSHVPRESNYGQPQCAVTPGAVPTAYWIPLLLFLLVLSVVAPALLVYTDFISVRRNPLPRVLRTVRHIEERLCTPDSTVCSSVFISEPTAPSSGAKESDTDSLVQSSAGSRRGYKLRLGTNMIVAFSSPLTPPPPRGPGLASSPSPSSSHQNPVLLHSDSSSSGADFRNSPITSTSPLWDGRTESTQDAPGPPPPPADTGASSSAEGPAAKDEGEDAARKDGGQDVNLLTLTFGGHEEAKDVKSPSASAAPLLTWDATETAVEMDSCGAGDQEEEEECCGYMSRP